MSRIRNIVHSAGGPAVVALRSEKTDKEVTADAVFKWYRNGIPAEHWKLIMQLTGGTETVETLYAANQEAVAEKAKAKRRKEKSVGNGRAVAA